MTDVTRTATLPTPAGGWFHPWPNLFELAAHVPTNEWTLVGRLMVQAHALSREIDAVRPTADLDVLLHIEISAAVVTRANGASGDSGAQPTAPPTAGARGWR